MLLLVCLSNCSFIYIFADIRLTVDGQLPALTYVLVTLHDSFPQITNIETKVPRHQSPGPNLRLRLHPLRRRRQNPRNRNPPGKDRALHPERARSPRRRGIRNHKSCQGYRVFD